MKWLPTLIGLALSGAMASGASLASGEWFLDADPGFGAGNAFPATAAATAVSIPAAVIHALPPGLHLLGVRMRDSDGTWGQSIWRSFLREPAPLQSPFPTGGEWFIDADPGPGKGTGFTAGPGTAGTVSVQLTAANLQAFAPGLHLLGVRMRDSRGTWSQSIWRSFLKDSSPAEAPKLAAFEYRITNGSTPVATRTISLVTPASAAELPVTHGKSGLETGVTYGLQVTPVDTAGRKGLAVNAVFAYQPYTEAWQETNFSPTEQSDPAVSGSDADPDGDGLSNGTERLFAMNPRDGADAAKAGPQIAKDPGEEMRLRFRVPAGGSVGNDGIYRTSSLSYQLLEGPMPAAENAVPAAWIKTWSLSPLEDGAGILEYRLSPPASARRFFRLRGQ
jgi:hypothetical protein